MKRVALLLLPVLLVCGCAEPEHASLLGQPEVRIHARKGLALEAFAAAYRRDGWRIRSFDADSLVLEKAQAHTSSALLLGARYASAAQTLRLTLTFSGAPGFVTVRARSEMVADPGAADETVTDFSTGGTGLQQSLEEVKAQLEGGVLGFDFDKSLVVTSVLPGGPAAQAGIAPGDQLASIAGMPVLSYDEASSFLRGKPGSEVDLEFLRGARKAQYTLRRVSYASVYRR